jgi:RNA polymerase sigma-70 factor, ECF subfamily
MMAIERATVIPNSKLTVKAIDELVHAQYPRLIRVAAVICHEPQDAQDAVQEALIRAWRNQSQLRDSLRFEAWLTRIVVREAIRLENRRRGVLRMWLSPVEEYAEPKVVDPDIDLRRALDRLSVEQRAALVLHYLIGCTVAETATAMQASIETTRSRLRAGRARLRAVMEDME